MISKRLLLVRAGGEVFEHSIDQSKADYNQCNRNVCTDCSSDSRGSSHGSWKPFLRFADRSLLLLNILVFGAEVKPLGLEQRLFIGLNRRVVGYIASTTFTVEFSGRGVSLIVGVLN